MNETASEVDKNKDFGDNDKELKKHIETKIILVISHTRPLIRGVSLITSLIDERAATHDRINPDGLPSMQYLAIVKSEGFDRLPRRCKRTDNFVVLYTYNPFFRVCGRDSACARALTHTHFARHEREMKFYWSVGFFCDIPRSTVAPAREQNATKIDAAGAQCCN